MERELQEQTEPRDAGEWIAAAIAHEVNNLLTPVVGLADLLEHTSGDDQVRDQLIERAVDRCQRAVAICSLLVDLNKHGSDEAPTSSLSDALQSVLAAAADRAKDTGVSLELSHDGPGQIAAPAIVVEHIVLNLVLNAINASPSGSRISISTAYTPATAWKHATWLVWIDDQGRGLDERSVASINSGGLPQGSKGIGLVVVRMLCQRWGGKLRVTSVPGQGTTFHVELPAT